MLARRIITAVLGIPIMVALIEFGGWILVGGAGILMTVVLFEIKHMLRPQGQPFFWFLAILWAWAILLSGPLHYPLGFVLAAGLAVSGFLTLSAHDPEGFLGALTTSWIALYLGWFFSFLGAMRTLAEGRTLLFGFFAIVWLTDAAAFFVGRWRGGRKLWPRVSPGKTWSGAVAGAITGTLVGAGWSVAISIPAWQGAMVGLVLSGLGQIGDLVESNVKRYAGVKDSGEILPGHGGIFDRFDSALFALPAAYYLFKGLGF